MDKALIFYLLQILKGISPKCYTLSTSGLSKGTWVKYFIYNMSIFEMQKLKLVLYDHVY